MEVNAHADWHLSLDDDEFLHSVSVHAAMATRPAKKRIKQTTLAPLTA